MAEFWETDKGMSIEKGIDIQNRQLKEWESVLTVEAGKKLREWAESKNGQAKSGYDIVRGQDLGVYIQNELTVKY